MVLEAKNIGGGEIRVGVGAFWRLGIRVNGLGNELSVPCEGEGAKRGAKGAKTGAKGEGRGEG